MPYDVLFKGHRIKALTDGPQFSLPCKSYEEAVQIIKDRADYFSLDESKYSIRLLPEDPKPGPVDPPHYTKLDPEPIDVIEKWGLNFRLSNVVKYIARHGRKPGEDAASDLRKARNYLNREINAIDGVASWDAK